jgi:hypothetical protein
MHELPKDLDNSLRSFRNSVHRHSGQHDFDLERLNITPENVTGVEDKKHLRETSSSLILVCVLYTVF